MALTITTVRPIVITGNQLGAGGNSVVGAATAAAAWSDNLTSSYVQLTARCRNDPEVVRVGFPTPTITTGARILSVGLRRQVLTIPSTSLEITCLHWFRCLEGGIEFFGQILIPGKIPFRSPCPTDQTGGGAWFMESLGVQNTAPSGAAWDITTNLKSGNFFYDYGRGDDIGGNHRVAEVYLDITYQQQSTVAVTAPTSPNPSTQPTVTWTFTSPDSQPQESYWVVVYTAAQVAALGFVPFTTPPIMTSGPTFGEDLQWTLPNSLPGDGSYTAYVRCTAKWAGPGDFTAADSSITWTRNVSAGGSTGGGTTQPAAVQPPNAVLSTAIFDVANDRVILTMVPSSSSPTTAAYDVQVSRTNGVSWYTPPSLTQIPATGMTPVVQYDYQAPIAASSQYRVLSYSQSSGIYVAAAGVSNTITVQTSGGTWRLVDPSNPLNNTIVIPVGDKTMDGKADKITFPRLSGTFYTLGGTGEQPPITVSGPTYGEAGTLMLIFAAIDQGADYWPAFRQLMQSGHTLLLKKPFADQKWVTLATGMDSQDPELAYGPVPGNPNAIYYRKITVPYTQTRPPAFF